MTRYCHQKYCHEILHRPSLCFLRPHFLPLDGRPHPIWSSCGSSASAVKAATVQARLLTGRYQHDLLRSKWDGGDGSCRIQGCGAPDSDTIHLLSGQCAPLRPFLSNTLKYNLKFLEDYPDILQTVLSALSGSPFDWVTYLLDPSCDPILIQISQMKGPNYIWPVFKLSRSLIWTMHKNRLKLLGLERFL